jgi:GR25 family glycosyltransferase involved in LPS biosynthesis
VSDLSNLSIAVLHGVTGEETIHSPAIPTDTKLRPAELGCWRSHVNAWKHMLESGVETALILEDDADWHVNIKEQMSLLSQNMMKFGNPLLMDNNGTEIVKDKEVRKEEGLAPYSMSRPVS